MNLCERSLRELSEMLKDKRIMVMELLNDYLDAALKGSCITFCSEKAFEAAIAIDTERLNRAEVSPIEGFPFSLKDNIRTAGIQTSCNSRSLKSYTPDSDAFIVEKLYGLGAVLTAKNCMREFSIGKMEDSAFELRNYLVWTGTNKNVNIGAFSIGTDLGLCDFYCGLWTFKPSLHADMLSDGIITGSPSLEKITYSARRADDLRFLYPFLCGDGIAAKERSVPDISPQKYKVLVCDSLNMPEYIAEFLDKCGFSVCLSNCRFIDNAELIYDCVLATEFFSELRRVGLPELGASDDSFSEAIHIKNRTEGIGFEVKKLILTGAHLLSPKNKESTLKIMDLREILTKEILKCLSEYDFIVAPATFGDKLSKASAVAKLPELIVPFGDVLPFKMFTLPRRERLLLDTAVYLEERL